MMKLYANKLRENLNDVVHMILFSIDFNFLSKVMYRNFIEGGNTPTPHKTHLQ